MFRITNIQSRLQENCANRDDLLSAINEKSVWAEDRGEVISLQLEQLSEDGTILDSMNLSLPLHEIVESALASFGLKKEKRGFSLLHRNKPQALLNKQTSVKKDEQQRSEPVSAPQIKNKKVGQKTVSQLTEVPAKSVKPKKVTVKKEKSPKIKSPKTSQSGSLLWRMLTIGALGVSLVTFSYSQSQIKALADRLTVQEKQGKVEVVARYFIANYYSGDNKRLDDFLSKNLKAEGVEAKTGQRVQSMIFESIKPSRKQLKLTFIVSTKSDDEVIKTVRLHLSFVRDNKSVYGYVVTSQPKFSGFAK